MADKERQSRLTWRLSGCFQEDPGRPPLPRCDERFRVVHCRKRLSEAEDKVFLELFLETTTLCHQLQAEAFKNQAEHGEAGELPVAVGDGGERQAVHDRRDVEQIIQESTKLHGSMSFVVSQTEHLTAASNNIKSRIGDVLEQSAAIAAGGDAWPDRRRHGKGGGGVREARRINWEAEGGGGGDREGGQARWGRHGGENGGCRERRRRPGQPMTGRWKHAV
jgi:hypothetical protein